MESATILTPRALALAVFCFPFEPNIPEGPEYEKYQHYKKVSEYDQEIPQSQTADKPMSPRGRATQQSRDTRKTN